MNHKKKIFYIADLHLFSESVIGKHSRPFQTPQEMNEKIRENWNKTVSPYDTVFIVGDLCAIYVKNGAVKKFIESLHGEKHLILGNHEQYVKNKRELFSCFKSVKKYAKIVDNERTVILFHYPIEQWEGAERGSFHIHGHIHGKEAAVIKNRFNVSAEAVDYTPVTLDELIKKKGICVKEIKAIECPTLSEEEEKRYIILEMETGEVLEHGYRFIRNSYAFYKGEKRYIILDTETGEILDTETGEIIGVWIPEHKKIDMHFIRTLLQDSY